MLPVVIPAVTPIGGEAPVGEMPNVPGLSPIRHMQFVLAELSYAAPA